MMARYLVILLVFACMMLIGDTPVSGVEQPADASFRAVLELAEIGEDKLSRLADVESLTDTDWSIVLQVIDRLKQFRALPATGPPAAAMPVQWEKPDNELIGEIFEIDGRITSVATIPLTDKLAQLHGVSEIYASQFFFLVSEGPQTGTVVVLSSRIPMRWQTQAMHNEPVAVRCALASAADAASDRQAVVIADHISWYPTTGAPTGQLLLARQRMDVALLDEVVHRKPFVKPTVSREGEAFYAGLLALRAANQAEIIDLAKANVGRVAATWRGREPELDQQLIQQREQLAQAETDEERKRLSLEVRRAKTRRDLATTIARQATNGQSSVATMFLQPEREVGELFYFEGTARRAVWIAAVGQDGIAGYYELEVFPSEARLLDNRPIVCCVGELPEGFAVGDEIREPVRIAGVFFKSWQYRGRDTIGARGETESQRRLYTPVLLSKQPIWLKRSGDRTNAWAIWGGAAFLVALLVLWASMAWLSRSDRQARRNLRRHEVIDL